MVVTMATEAMVDQDMEAATMAVDWDLIIQLILSQLVTAGVNIVV